MPQTIPRSTRLVSLYDRLLARIASVPGVQGVGAAATVPLGEPWIGLIEIEGRPELRQPIGGYNLLTEGFFDAVGVPLLSGRLLNHSDNAGTEPVTVVNKAMADRYWPGRDPIGLRFRAVNMDRGEPVWYRIVGVVGNVRTLSLEHAINLSTTSARDSGLPCWPGRRSSRARRVVRARCCRGSARVSPRSTRS